MASVLSSTHGNKSDYSMTEGRYFQKMEEIAVVDGWIGFSSENDIHSMLSVVRSLYLYYNRNRAGIPYAFLADPVFINRVNTLSQVFEYRHKGSIPDGIDSLMDRIQRLKQQQKIQEQLGIAFAERARERARQQAESDQVVPTVPTSTLRNEESLPDTPDTEPLEDRSFDGFNSSDSDSVNQENVTNTSNSSISTTVVPDNDNQENRDPDEVDMSSGFESFLSSQRGTRRPLRPLQPLVTTRRSTFSDADLEAMRPPSGRRRKRFTLTSHKQAIPTMYYRQEKVIVSHNMRNTPLEWFSTVTPPFTSNEPVLIEAEDQTLERLLEFLLEKRQEQDGKGLSEKSALTTALQSEEVRMFVGYWLEHLTTKLYHIANGQAMTYLSYEALQNAKNRAEERLREEVTSDIYDFSNKTNIEKSQLPYIVTKRGYSYNIIYYVPLVKQEYVAYKLNGDDRQIKFQDQLFDMTIKPNNSIALLGLTSSKLESEMSAKLTLPTYEGAVPTMQRVQEKCTKIKKFYCAINRLRPVLDACLKALILKQQNAYALCAGRIERGTQRVVRIALNKFQFFVEKQNTQKVMACKKKATALTVPPSGLATIQLNDTCKQIFVNDKQFKYEPSTTTCIQNTNPCIRKVTNPMSKSQLTDLLNKLIKNPLQNSIDIIATITTRSFWSDHQPQIIITVVIVLLIAVTGLVLANLFKIARYCLNCFSAAVRHGVEEHELEPLDRPTLNSQNNPKRVTVAAEPTMSLCLSEVQGLPSNESGTVQNVEYANLVHTGSKPAGYPPSYTQS